jgi:hypothetical protein
MTYPNAQTVFSDLIEQSRHEHGVGFRQIAGSDEIHATYRKPAVASGILDLRSLVVMPKASNNVLKVRLGPLSVNSFESHTVNLAAAVAQNCRVCEAGATLVVLAPRDMGSHPSGLPVLYRDAGVFRTTETAKFGLVADGADAVDSPHPWHDAVIEWPNAPSVAFHTTFNRASQKGVGGGDALEESLLESIISGLAEAVDSALLAAIIAAAPANFTLAAAAARGLPFASLRSMVGTDGTAAAVGADGNLRASGIAAELTRTVTKTVIGAFAKSAVAIHPDIQLHFERLNVNGSMGATVFASILPLIPDATAFWLAGA